MSSESFAFYANVVGEVVTDEDSTVTVEIHKLKLMQLMKVLKVLP